MATVKRFNKLLGLENIDVLIDERDTSRHIIITDMPQSLPQGKSSFLIEVSPYMKEGVELQVDFMDSEGNSIYLEPVQNYLEGSSRTMSVEIYDTTAAGVATMILVGELDRIPTTPGSTIGNRIWASAFFPVASRVVSLDLEPTHFRIHFA